MEYMTPKEAAEKWGYTEATIRDWCKKELIFVVSRPEKISGRWRIPANAECPKPIKTKK